MRSSANATSHVSCYVNWRTCPGLSKTTLHFGHPSPALYPRHIVTIGRSVVPHVNNALKKRWKGKHSVPSSRYYLDCLNATGSSLTISLSLHRSEHYREPVYPSQSLYVHFISAQQALLRQNHKIDQLDMFYIVRMLLNESKRLGHAPIISWLCDTRSSDTSLGTDC